MLTAVELPPTTQRHSARPALPTFTRDPSADTRSESCAAPAVRETQGNSAAPAAFAATGVFAQESNAGRAHYDELLSGGVQLFERRDVLLHSKTAVIDGV